MKNWKNILLTIAAVLMLMLFAWVVTSPTLTEQAFDEHQNLESPFDLEEDSEDSSYDFL